MRTKTMLLSALLGTLGSVSLMAQSTNVYSLNVVGYINVTIPASSYAIITCPLIGTPDNSLTNLIPNTTGEFFKSKIYLYNPTTGYNIISGTKTDWGSGSTNQLLPGQAAFFLNANTTNVTLTFVGSVPSGAQNNVLQPGYNLVGSILPSSGDLITNSLTAFTNANFKDKIYVYSTNGYNIYSAGKNGVWPTDPVIPSFGEGFFYENTTTTPLTWAESFSVSNP